MRVNPFQPIYDACNTGDSRAKLAALPDFPRLMDIELTNLCNFRCLMCPTGTFSQKRDKGFLEDAVFAKLLDEVAPHGTALRFIRFGEPTMHPRFLDYVRLAHERGLLTHVNTNGSKLDDDTIRTLCDIPLDSLKFSFQGVDRKSYGEMRNIDFFEGLVDTIGRFRAIRGDRLRPYLHVSTSITYESAEQVADFIALITPLVDKVSVGHTVLDHLDMNAIRLRPDEVTMLERLKRQQSLVKEHPECPEVYDKLSLNWDGTVSACCADSDNKMVIGDFRTASLADIWHAPVMERYREVLARGGHDELDLCKTCYNYAGLYKTLTPPGEQDDSP
jgi:MoaA/NifB/PqqE/SkfB family radical SAM enzyme